MPQMSEAGHGRLPAESGWERRHPGLAESWCFDFWAPDASLGGFVALVFHADPAVAWYWAGLVGAGRAYLLVRDLEVELPRRPTSCEIRSEALWADLNCETPFDHWSLGLEAFGVTLDDPEEALRGERGHRSGLGLDLEWEAAAAVVGTEGSYQQPGTVHGEILVGGGGDVESVAFDGDGWRRHTWGRLEWLRPSRSWLGGRLAEGGRYLAGAPGPEEVTPVHRAPLLLEGGGRQTVLERCLCRFAGPDGRPGLGWAEWLKPVEQAE